ncbi:MAG TPA: hypothetical protein VGH75_08195 [Steroidobacteraceae bacterium]
MLDLIGAIVGMSAIGINLVAFTNALPGTLAHRLGLAAIAGAWVGLASGLGAAGTLAFAPNNPVPLIGVLFAVPLLVVGVLALRSQGVRAALLAVPMQLLIGLNSLRVLGVLFLLLAANGRLSGPFPYSAGLGDIITGALAIPLALNIARSGRPSLRAIRRWNIFGALDLVVAVALGITSADGSPLQVIHAGVGSEAMQYLPYCLVPTVLVPFYLITHATVAAQLAAARATPALRRATVG